jgi:predicted nucleic acid-binding protein
MSVDTFVDTNVLIYAHDVQAGEKRERAAAVLREIWENQSGAVSTQVLQEFYVNVTRKIAKPLRRSTAREIIERYGAWHLIVPDIKLVVDATKLEQQKRISFWDAMIVVAAQWSGASTLLTEDLSHGQRFGPVTVRDPFARREASED